MEKKFGLPENFCKFEKELLNYPSVHCRLGSIQQLLKKEVHLKNEAKRQKQEKVDYTAPNEVYILAQTKYALKYKLH